MDNPAIMDPSASLLSILHNTVVNNNNNNNNKTEITTITTTTNTTIPSDSNATLSISQNLSQEATSEPPEPLDITSHPSSTANFPFTQNQQQFGPSNSSTSYLSTLGIVSSASSS